MVAKRQKFDALRFKIIQKSLGASIKLIKILGLEPIYSKEYSDVASKYASITTLQIFYNLYQKFFF